MRASALSRSFFGSVVTALLVAVSSAGSASAGTYDRALSAHQATPAPAAGIAPAVASRARPAPAAAAAPALVGTPPTAALTVTPTAGAAPLTVTADASASRPGSSPIASYAFSWGDGSSSPAQATATAQHLYTAAGTFTVTVTVTDNQILLPGTSTASATVRTATTVVGPTAVLSVSPASGPAPLTVTASGTGSVPGTFPITAYTFVWGDGSSSGPSASPSQGHTYPGPGPYTVTLTVADGEMPPLTNATTFQVNVGAGVAPTPSLVLTPPSGPTPLTVTANAAGSTPGSSPIATYAFDFGDGTVIGPQAMSSAQHVYPIQGLYTVRLTVVDHAGLSAVTTAQATVGPPPGTLVHRIAGPDRYATGIAVSVAHWDPLTDTAAGARHPHSVVLARGDEFADALAGIPLAAKGYGPLLLSHPAGLQPEVLAEIQRILPAGATVHLLGGPAALSPAVEAALKSAGYVTDRLAGDDRYQTALRIAVTGLGDPRHILVARGDDFPDALAAGPFAVNGFSQNGQPAAVILSQGANLPPEVADYVRSKAPGSTNSAPDIIGIGGPGAYAVAAVLPTSQFDALVGADRFDTAAKLAPYFSPVLPYGLVDGVTFPDALTGGAAMALSGGPVLLAEPGLLPDPTARVLAAARTKTPRVEVYGGTAALSDATVQAASAAVGGRIG